MQIILHSVDVDLSGERILEGLDMEINKQSRIAVVGRNGCGKTTLLRLLSGEISPAIDQGVNSFMSVSGEPVIGKLDQMTFSDESRTLTQEIRSSYSDIIAMKARLDELLFEMDQRENSDAIKEYTSLLERFTNEGGFYFEKEYEAAIKRFGFSDEDKKRAVSEFSGGQRTKIAFLKLLLSRPDLLLLDEPTNHLDIDAVTWLEDYLRDYKKAVVIVSHDRMFLDRTVNEVYEIEFGKMTRYTGNYTQFTQSKRQRRELQAKQHDAQQKEIARISAVAERFRYKATKAAMAQSKLKQIERMEKIEAPDRFDERTFHARPEIARQSAKDVLDVTGLTIGFDKPLCTVDLTVKRGDRLGIIGGNGLGKSTFLKTIVGKIPALGGEYKLGAMVDIGYFDQQLAQIRGAISVFDDFSSTFPSLNDFQVRSALGAFLFSGEDVFKSLDVLSGGERVRLALCKLFRRKPNLLILDEPTNHMDIISKEALEDMLDCYEGTIIFVSHDRYFVKKLAHRILAFEGGAPHLYENRYEHYLELKQKSDDEQEVFSKERQRPAKKSFITPGKQKSRLERAVKKAEERISLLEERIDGLKQELVKDENISDYIRLAELQSQIDSAEEELIATMTEWEESGAALEKLLCESN